MCGYYTLETLNNNCPAFVQFLSVDLLANFLIKNNHLIESFKKDLKIGFVHFHPPSSLEWAQSHDSISKIAFGELLENAFD